MKVIDAIRGILIFLGITTIFYFLTESLIDEYEKRKKYYKIEFNGQKVYWADSVNVVSQKEIHFFDVHSKRNVKLYGYFSISTPKK